MWKVSQGVNTKLQVLLLIVLGTFAQGCALLPVPHSGSMETYIDDDRTEFIEVGTTSKEQVDRVLGKPGWIGSDGAKWVYPMQYGTHGGLKGCLAVAGMGDGDLLCAGTSVKLYILELDFNANDIVSRSEKSALRSESCTDDGVCVHRKGDIEMDVDRIRRNMTSIVVGGTCSVIFLRTGKMEYIGLEVDLLGEQIGRLGSDHYATLDVLPGRHVLTVSAMPFDDTVKREYRSIGLDCQERETIYIHEKDAAADFELQLLIEEVGPPQYIVDRRYSRLSPPYKEEY